MNKEDYKLKTGIHTGGKLPPWTDSDAAAVAAIIDGIIARRAKGKTSGHGGGSDGTGDTAAGPGGNPQKETH